MIAWHLLDLKIVRPPRIDRGHWTAPVIPLPTPWESGWRALSAVLQRLRHRFAAQHAALDVPEAIGATDRELARLGPDPARALADGVRNAQWLRADLALSRYR